MRRNRLFLTLLVAGLAARSGADDVRPVQVQLREQEPFVFVVQWQVPKKVPLQAKPRPVLPERCRPEGEELVQDEPAAWIHRQTYRCPGGLSGRTLRIDYPFVNTALSTLFRLSLLSGEEHARILAPGEDEWTVPEAPPDVLRKAQRGVSFGAEHVFDDGPEAGVHVAFAAVIGFLGTGALAGRFALGQFLALLGAVLGLAIEPILGEVGLAIAVTLLARQALLASDGRRRVLELTAAAGLVHGLGLAARVEGDALSLAGAVLGMDATFLVLGMAVGLLSSRRRALYVAAYGAGVLSVAAGLSLFFQEPAAVAARPARLPPLAQGGVEAPGSRRLVPSNPEAPLQSFVAIEAFETRHEVLVRPGELFPGLSDPIEPEAQAAIKERVASFVTSAAVVRIDGERRVPLLDRVEFVTLDRRGVLSRPAPIAEALETALVGVTLIYPTASMPGRLAVSFEPFPEALSEIPSVVIDPEATRTLVLSANEPTVTWKNALTRAPITEVSAIPVEPRRIPVPLLSTPFLIVTALALRRKRFAWARLAVTLAVLVAPLGDVALAFPSSGAPSQGAARRVLAGILPNLYRAFELRDASAAYDRLAVSVTGDTLTAIYLEHRRALEMEERGGARARVEAVEVGDVERVRPNDAGGFDAVASWTVGGTVTHFGHRHFRENRYRAELHVVPKDGQWKIHTIELLGEERVR